MKISVARIFLFIDFRLFSQISWQRVTVVNSSWEKYISQRNKLSHLYFMHFNDISFIYFIQYNADNKITLCGIIFIIYEMYYFLKIFIKV